MRLLVLLAVVACDAGLPPPTPTTPPPTPPNAIASVNGHQYAIVRVTEARPEPCMDTQPAANWTFSVEGAALKLFGDVHGALSDHATLPGRIMASAPGEGYYVADIALGEVTEPVTCNGLERFDGTVLAVAPARDLADARAKLAAVSRTELAALPAAAILANPIVSASGHHYAIVQVRSSLDEGCTNMGGTDWTFSVQGMPAAYQLHGGGHGIFAKGSRLPSAYEPHDDMTSVYFVAEVSLGRFSQRYICPAREVMYDGKVVAVAPARDLDDARAQLALAPSAGLHRAIRLDRFDE